MDKSFDEWMQQQFPNGEPEEEVDTSAELEELLERYDLPHQAILLICERVMPLFKAMGRIHNLAKRFEVEGVTRPGFQQDLEALLIRHIMIATKDGT